MSCSRRLAYMLLRARLEKHTNCTEMQRGLLAHCNPSASRNFHHSSIQSRLFPGCHPQVVTGAAASHQQQKGYNLYNLSGVAVPGLVQQRHWRRSGVLNQLPAAAANFTASTPVRGGLPDDHDEGPEGELHAVETAIRANALIFAAKLAVFFMSNSSAMLAEAVHSVVDIANQMLLRIGIMKAQKQPNEMHPYGYARDQFIWPLISAVGIFCCGAGVSFVHGVSGLFETHREIGDLYWNFVVLGVSGVLESHSLYVAVSTLRRRAAQQAMSLLAYIKTGADPAAVAVMMEDGAAVAGLFIAGGCLALCQMTGAIYWDSVGSIAVSGLLGVVAVTLIQRNRKWLIGKSMPKAQEEQILEHLLNDRVIRHVSNTKSEELGVRQYRFQADIAFDGEELARRALDRCGRVRLFKALDAAIRRHDPHALDALLMQFAAVIVSTTGAEVDRLEREIMRLVPGTRWVDLETDRGKPARLSSAYAAAAAAAAAAAKQPQVAAAATAAVGMAAAAVAGSAGQQHPQQQHQQQNVQSQQLRPLDSVSDQDHLADLTEYPLGSLGSFGSFDEVHDNVPEWIQAFDPGIEWAAAQDTSSSSTVNAAGAMRLSGADSSIVGGNYLSHEQMHAIEAGLFEGAEEPYKPFCNAMLEKLQPGGAVGGSSSSSMRPPASAAAAAAAATSVIGSGSARASADGIPLSWEMQHPRVPDSATQQQLAAWAQAESGSWTRGRSAVTGSSAAASSSSSSSSPAAQMGIGPGSSKGFCEVMAEKVEQQQQVAATAASSGSRSPAAAPEEQQWGEEHKRRTVQKLLELEDSVLARDGDPEEYKPFCESMFQSLHPNQPKLRRTATAAATRQQQQQQRQPPQQQQHRDEHHDDEEVELEAKQHQG